MFRLKPTSNIQKATNGNACVRKHTLSHTRLFTLVILCVFLMCSPTMAKNTKIKDVPTNHWAYQAVKKLVDDGYLGLYEDGTFRGESPVNRYTLANAISKMLVQLGEGTTTATSQDMQLIRKLSNEFRNELVLLTMENKELEKRLAKIEESGLVLAEDQTQNLSNIKMLSSEARKIQIQVSEISKQILEEKTRLTLLEKKFEAHESSQDRMGKEIKELRTQLDETKSEVRSNRFYTILIGLVGILVGMSL